MTAFALAAPVALDVIDEAYRKQWLWLGLTIALSLHALLLWSIRHSMPFRTLGVAIILGAIESLLLVFVITKLRTIDA